MVAWSLVVLTLVAVAIRIVVSPRTAGFSILTAVPALAFVVLGAVVVSRRAAGVVGWLMITAGAGFAVYDAASVYAYQGLVAQPGSLVGAQWAARLATWVWVLPFSAAFFFLPLLFPNGRPPSPRWRPLLYAMVTVSVVQLLVQPFRPGPLLVADPVTNVDVAVGPNPLGSAALVPLLPLYDAVINVSFFPILVALAASVVMRYRRASGDERYQLRWFLFAVAVLPIGFALSALSGGNVVVNVVSALATAGVPIAIGVAVLRYRLYDIDRIISRTVTYAAVSGVLAVVYAGVVILPSALFGLQSDLLVAAATLAAAGAFVPVRRRIQAAVDRRFNRARYDAQRVVERFSARVRDDLDLEAVAADLRGAVASTVQPTHVTLWLSGDAS